MDPNQWSSLQLPHGRISTNRFESILDQAVQQLGGPAALSGIANPPTPAHSRPPSNPQTYGAPLYLDPSTFSHLLPPPQTQYKGLPTTHQTETFKQMLSPSPLPEDVRTVQEESLRKSTLQRPEQQVRGHPGLQSHLQTTADSSREVTSSRDTSKDGNLQYQNYLPPHSSLHNALNIPEVTNYPEPPPAHSKSRNSSASYQSTKKAEYKTAEYKAAEYKTPDFGPTLDQSVMKELYGLPVGHVSHKSSLSHVEPQQTTLPPISSYTDGDIQQFLAMQQPQTPQPQTPQPQTPQPQTQPSHPRYDSQPQTRYDSQPQTRYDSPQSSTSPYSTHNPYAKTESNPPTPHNPYAKHENNSVPSPHSTQRSSYPNSPQVTTPQPQSQPQYTYDNPISEAFYKSHPSMIYATSTYEPVSPVPHEDPNPSPKDNYTIHQQIPSSKDNYTLHQQTPSSKDSYILHHQPTHKDNSYSKDNSYTIRQHLSGISSPPPSQKMEIVHHTAKDNYTLHQQPPNPKDNSYSIRSQLADIISPPTSHQTTLPPVHHLSMHSMTVKNEMPAAPNLTLQTHMVPSPMDNSMVSPSIQMMQSHNEPPLSSPMPAQQVSNPMPIQAVPDSTTKPKRRGGRGGGNSGTRPGPRSKKKSVDQELDITQRIITSPISQLPPLEQTPVVTTHAYDSPAFSSRDTRQPQPVYVTPVNTDSDSKYDNTQVSYVGAIEDQQTIEDNVGLGFSTLNQQLAQSSQYDEYEDVKPQLPIITSPIVGMGTSTMPIEIKPDEEFIHLAQESHTVPIPSPHKPSANKSSFQNSFLSFLQGNKPDTLANSTNMNTPKPVLPKYIPEPPRPKPPPRLSESSGDEDAFSDSTTFSKESATSVTKDTKKPTPKSKSTKSAKSTKSKSTVPVEPEKPQAKVPTLKIKLSRVKVPDDDDDDVVSPSKKSKKSKSPSKEKKSKSKGKDKKRRKKSEIEVELDYDPPAIEIAPPARPTRKAKQKIEEKRQAKKKKEGKRKRGLYDSDEDLSDEDTPYLPESEESESEKEYDSDRDPEWGAKSDVVIDEDFDKPKKGKGRGRGPPRKKVATPKNSSRSVSQDSSDSAASSNAGRGRKPVVKTMGLEQMKQMYAESMKLVKTLPAKIKSPMDYDGESTDEEVHDYTKGKYVIDRKDMTNYETFPIWKIDAGQLLQKYQAEKKDDGTLTHRSLTTYSSWTTSVKVHHLYKAILVDFVTCNKSVEVVKVRPEFLPSPPDPEIEKEPLMVSYNVYVQIMLSQAIEQSFLKTIIEAKEDYYLDPLKEIDAKLSDHLKTVLENLKWQDDFVACIEKYPYVKLVAKKEELPQNCMASMYPDTPSSKCVLFYGPDYNRETLEGALGNEGTTEDQAKAFNIGDAALDELRKVHQLHHYKYALLKKCHFKMQALKGNTQNKYNNMPNRANLPKNNEPPKDDQEVLDMVMQNRYWIQLRFFKFKKLIGLVRTPSQKQNSADQPKTSIPTSTINTFQP